MIPSSCEGPARALDARVKLLAAVAVLAATVTTPPDALNAFAGYALLLLTLALAARVPLLGLLRRFLPLMLFVVAAAALVPFLHRPAVPEEPLFRAGWLEVSRSGLILLQGVLAKSGIGLMCALLLGATTPFPELLRGLERLRVPRVLVALLGFTYRYVFVLVEEARRMLRARESRCYGGRWLWQAHVVGHMVGTLFLRAHDRAERVYAAMLARGFTGAPPHGPQPVLRARDYAFLGAVLSMAALTRLLLR